jgi:opacity protein-like surface antigen
MKTGVLALVLMAGAAATASAQTSGLSFRPLLMFSEQQFAASETFDAIFGQAHQSFWGGGLNITQDGRYYIEVTASRFEQTGQRVFVDSGHAYPLNIPLTASMTPIEFSAGYRFQSSKPIIPYLGAGIGAYHYKESSQFSSADEDIDTTHAGFIVEAGLEFRLHRWVGVSADAHYTYIPGIFGDAGASKEFDEKSLGGIAARFKVIVGK